ncbi:MAG: hypothetical protein DRO04_00085 [Candidatus Iainarchaeum archaeon]|uniref:Uncharacterized protein n=1 Tax=Candidatus Iainarchaeum sp. TaxID=3101447 RepID=A0A497JIC4_9ARCH|nr:MAG: hypothetical protein DRO04_00085 [Candidatus Diapherotrites archaeon]
METVLQYAAHAVREYSDGVYYSRNRAEEEGVEPTSFLVRKDIVYGLAIDEEAAKEGSEIYRWAKEYFADYTPADTANYEWNLKILLENDLVPYRAVGLAASLYAYYKRRQRERREREECRDAWLAPEGEKVEGEAIVITVCRVATFYGPSTLVKFITSDRHLCTTFSNAAWTLDVKEGHRIRFKGRVKRHTMYNGVKETQLTRVRVETLTE